MKKIRVAVIGIICIGLVVGFYFYLQHKTPATEQTEVSEVQKVLLKDISGDSYPETPREVIKFFNSIVCCYFNEKFTEDEFYRLADQALLLLDSELADNNQPEQYYLRLKTEIESYHEKDKVINSTSVCDTNEVKYAVKDGKEYAYVAASYFVKDKDGFTRTSQTYALRKDDQGKWKILAFELNGGDNITDEE